MKVLRVLPFPACCGIQVLGYWGWSTTNANASGPRDLSDLDADLKEAIKMYRSFSGMLVVAITNEQQPHVEYLLKKHDFTPLARDVYHPGHGKTLNLYAHIFHDKTTPIIGGEYGKVKEPAPKVARKSTVVEPAAKLTPRTTTLRPTPSQIARLTTPRRSILW